ncbi:hypothetical protein AVEN_207326-1 [Araneus ventricosus]|uniref:Uncharacterized protein n=1 Tax=Araneus ventricosus TaxID=182803 RepID=A0A4Y2KTQ4_ARAVE|nr:hypothetical protein AVEN_207326-1 [Araneus ventricosus]
MLSRLYLYLIYLGLEFILDIHSCRSLTRNVCLNVDYRPKVDKQVPRKVLAVLPAGAHALSGVLGLVNRSSEGSRTSIPRSALHSDTRPVFGGIRQLLLGCLRKWQDKVLLFSIGYGVRLIVDMPVSLYKGSEE